MAKSVDPESLRLRLTPLVENILSEDSTDSMERRLVEFGIECYHAGRKAERKYWGDRFTDLVGECGTPIFETIKIEAD